MYVPTLTELFQSWLSSSVKGRVPVECLFRAVKFLKFAWTLLNHGSPPWMKLFASKEQLNEKAKLCPYFQVRSTTTPPVYRTNIALLEHLDNTFESIKAAFKNDPMMLYLTAVRPSRQGLPVTSSVMLINHQGRDKVPDRASTFKHIWILTSKRQLKRAVNYTVNAGDSVIFSYVYL